MSRVSTETEMTIYARMDDLSELESAATSIEDHIQLECTLITGSRQRVRKVTPISGDGVGSIRYEFTTKLKLPDEGGIPSSLESTVDCDEEFYKSYSDMAARGIVKRRYSIVGGTPKITGVPENIVLPAIRYEVDVFTIPSNPKEKSKWIKMDIELQDIIKALKEQGISLEGVKQKFNLQNLAFTMQDMFSPASMNEEQKALLDKLWKTEFAMELNPEVYVKKEESSTQGTPETAPAAPAEPVQPEPQQDPTATAPDQGTETETEGEGNQTEEE